MKSPALSRWEEIYDSRLELMNRDYQVEDWSERAEDYSESRRTDNYHYGRSVYDLLKKHRVVSSESRVIEVGSGPGTFVIPFAQKVSHFTAIEPAEGMMAKIHENAAEADLSNYRIIPSIWQDVDVNKEAGRYDLLISSTVIWMFRDILDQIRRMEKVSSGYCCLCAGTGINLNASDDLWIRVVGDRPRPEFPEYPLIHSILYENGIYPEVRIIRHESRRSPENMIRMYSVFYNLFTSLTPEKNDLIKRHVTDHLQDGEYVMKFQSAVLWWRSTMVEELS